MELTGGRRGLFDEYLAQFDPLIGDRRTGRLFGGVVARIIGAESLVCARVAAGFLYELGVTLDWPEVRLLTRLGGWVSHKDRPPGKTLITRGRQRLLDHWATDAILADEIAQHGALPPRTLALLGRGPTP